MSDSTTTVRNATEQPKYDAATVRRANNIQRAEEERDRRFPYFHPITQLACAVAWGLEEMTRLEQLAAGKSGPIDASDPDDLRWEDLLSEMAGWRWAHEYALDLLRSQFTPDVEEALYEGDYLDDEECAAVHARENARYLKMMTEAEDDAQAQADAPTVAELPPAKGRPYWLAPEGRP